MKYLIISVLFLSFIPIMHLNAQGWLVQYSDQTDDTLNSISSMSNLNIAWAVGNKGKILRGVHQIFATGIECTDWDLYDIPGFNESPWDFKGVDCVYSVTGEIVFIVGTSRDPHLAKHGVVLRYKSGNWDWQTSWELLSDSIAFYDIAFANEDVGYITAGKGNILKTDDGGNSWHKPYIHDNRPGEISDVFRYISVDHTNENYLWATSDCFQNPVERGMIVSSTNGGASWQFHKPFCLEHTYHGIPDYPEPPLIGDFDGYRAPNGIFIDSYDGKIWVSLSMGAVARYDGSWARLDIDPYDIWLKGVSRGAAPIVVGTSNLIERKAGATWLEENLTLGKDLMDIDVNENDPNLKWACGTGGEILCSQYPAVGFSWGPIVNERSGYLELDWTCFDYTEVYVDGWDIYAADCPLQPYNEWRYIGFEPSTPGVNHVVPDYGVQYSIPYYYILISHMTFFNGEITVDTEYGPFSGTPNGLTIPPIPDEPTNIRTEDVLGDDGYKIRVRWDGTPTGGYFLIGKKRPNESIFKPFGKVPETQNFFEGDVQCGREYIYTVLAHVNRPSNYPANPASGFSTDNNDPTGIPYWEEFHYNTTTKTYYACWKPDLSTSLGGYLWCPIVGGDFDLPKHINTNVPIQRPWFKEYIDFPAGYRFDYFVISFDRNEHFAPSWLWDWFIIPALNVTDMNATYANNGKRLQRHANGDLYLAFSSGDPAIGEPRHVYFSQSSDEGGRWLKEYVSEGDYPTMDLQDDNLHLIWVEGFGENARLMYTNKKITDSAFPPKTCLYDASLDPQVKRIGPPSIAISQDNIFVTWESRWGPPNVMAFPVLFAGEFPIGLPSDFTYEQIDVGSVLRSHCATPIPLDTLFEPKCPSITVDKYGKPYIAWDRSNLDNHFMDIVIWERDNGTWSETFASDASICSNEEDPYITFENDAVHCVWSGEDVDQYMVFNISHIMKYPGQSNGGWSEPEFVYSSTIRQKVPIFEKGYAIWSENDREISLRRYDYGYFDWQTAALENVEKVDNSWNTHPIATSSDLYLYILWSQRDKFQNSYIHRDRRAIVFPPHYASNLGGEEKSPFTVERDGYMVYGDEYYKSLDYDSTKLVYRVQGLETEPGKDLKLMFYHEFGDAIKLGVRIDDTWTHNVWVLPCEPISVHGIIPVHCLQDGEIDITIEAISPTQDAFSVCSALWINDEQGGGGPMSSGIGAMPLIYSLKQPMPNPFSSKTVICYSLAKPDLISLKIYDQAGRLVKTLENGIKDSGVYGIRWDGFSDNSKKVSDGVYFVRLKAGGFSSVKKVILMR